MAERIDITAVPLKQRIHNAKQFLRDEPDEQKVTAARIFALTKSTLCSSIDREKEPPKQHGGQNKILNEIQTAAILEFIRSLLAYDVSPTRGIIQNAILNLKRQENPLCKAPSDTWFLDWYKRNELHTIKTKPLATVRFTAAQETDVVSWFRGYKAELMSLGITLRKNVINFDEGGFRVGCMKGHQVIVPDDIREVSFGPILLQLFVRR
jgi:hypothetical protein